MTGINEITAKEYVAALVERSRAAFKKIEYMSQEEVDHMVAKISWELDKEEVRQTLADMAMEESGFGDIPSKLAKVDSKIRGVYSEIKHRKTVGVIEENKEMGYRKLAKPAGVIGAIIPSTQPDMTPITTALFAMKSRDTVIFAPHPRGRKVGMYITELLQDILEGEGLPREVFLCIEPEMCSELVSRELMSQVDLVLATGGGAMVKAAYSSGTPAYGVGAGNGVMVIDDTADLKDMALKVRMSKTFDKAAGCSCDNSLVIFDSVYDEAVAALEGEGAFLAKDHDAIRKAIFPNWPKDHVINTDVVAKPVETIADIAGISIPEGTQFILVEESGTGHDYPLSGEKLCLVIALYRVKDIEEATELVNEIHSYSGAGHSCGIYSTSEENIMHFATYTHTVRVNNNLPNALVNTGSWTAGYPFSASLGCGTWGGNSCAKNVDLEYYMNYTYLATEIERHIPTDEELWGDTGIMD
ncbi:MAG: aldehyde dehydrogenase family protein [Firmicutes bacterium]|nr:aldehyde dehydrogenase family protein [Bacillota bacterium]